MKERIASGTNPAYWSLGAFLTAISLFVYLMYSIYPNDSLPYMSWEISLPLQHSSAVASHPTSINRDYTIPGDWDEVNVIDGDTIDDIFYSVGLDTQQRAAVMNAGAQTRLLRHLHSGQTFYFLIDSQNHLQQLVFEPDATEFLIITASSVGYSAERVKRQLVPHLDLATLTIHHSLSRAGVQAGLNAKLIKEVSKIFANDASLQHGIHKGDQLKIVYQNIYAGDKKIGTGDIMAAELVDHNHNYTAIRYEQPNGAVGYYTPQGHSLEPEFLRYPLHFKYISSGFNPNRYQPILHIYRPHWGVDLAAPYGTPIKATADGKVTYVGFMNGYGRIVILQNEGDISTRFAHMSRFATGLHVGTHVQEGEVIGYVGRSGLATGPHLHYEYRIDGRAVNPVTVRLPQATPINPLYLNSFNVYAQNMLTILSNNSKTA